MRDNEMFWFMPNNGKMQQFIDVARQHYYSADSGYKNLNNYDSNFEKNEKNEKNNYENNENKNIFSDKNKEIFKSSADTNEGMIQNSVLHRNDNDDINNIEIVNNSKKLDFLKNAKNEKNEKNVKKNDFFENNFLDFFKPFFYSNSKSPILNNVNSNVNNDILTGNNSGKYDKDHNDFINATGVIGIYVYVYDYIYMCIFFWYKSIFIYTYIYMYISL
jgi:hypothetical protein